jgi:hypothetical protein
MQKLRTISTAVAVVALALAARPALAEDGTLDAGWNTKYGMIFSLQNVFNDSNGILAEYGGGVGLQYNLAPERALRFAVSFSRDSQATSEAETTNLVTGVTTKTLNVPAGFLSAYDVDFAGSYLIRLGSAALAPYLGFGGELSYFQGSRKYEDDLSSTTQTLDVDNMTRTYGLAALGQLISVGLVERTSTDNETTTTSNTTGTLLSGTKSESSSTKWFNFGTGLNQGAELGLVAHF